MVRIGDNLCQSGQVRNEAAITSISGYPHFLKSSTLK